MRENDFTYIEGENERDNFPLRNFLPPCHCEIFYAWIAENQLQNHYLIDPTSTHPYLSIALADKGVKVLAARSNPINWLITEVLSKKANRHHMRNAVNKLLISRKDGLSLEELLQPIYLTPCNACGKVVQADGFVWEKDNSSPISRVYICPFCGDAGERDITARDLDNLQQLGNLEIYRSRALQRVNPEKGYEEETLQSALSCYLPRALYVCMLLINRYYILNLKKELQIFLQAALLTVFNSAHSLRHWPPQNYRFLQFAVPQRYFEKNLFLSLTRAEKQWPEIKKATPISYWPNLPPDSGGVCFFQTRLADKNNIFQDIEQATVATIFPRPGQTYWTLSALWAGWLWGKKAVKPMRSALRRRRYGWYWYTKAIYQSITRLHFSPNRKVRFFGLFPYFTPNLIFGLFAGMQSAGFTLQGAAFRQKESLLQANWVKNSLSLISKGEEINFKETIKHCLENLNEPLDFQDILMMAILQIALNGQAGEKISDIEESDFSSINHQTKTCTELPGFLFVGRSENQSTKKYLLYQKDIYLMPLSDRVEEYIFHLLGHSNEISYRSIDRLTCANFKGYLTPKKELVENVIDSYAEAIDDRKPTVRLRFNESTEERKKDIIEIAELLRQIGTTLGYDVLQNGPITWVEKGENRVRYIFHITAHASVAKFMLAPSIHEDSQYVFIYPGSRAALVYYRLTQDFRFEDALSSGWHLVKFRHIRHMAEIEAISHEIWKHQLDSDPPVKAAPAQLKIL